MSDDVHVFTYTARRSSFLTIVSAILFLCLVEAGALALIIFVLVKNLYWELLLNGAHTLLCLYILYALFKPLWTRHILTATHLYLNYGTTLRVEIERSSIARLEPQQDQQAALMPIAARYDEGKRRVYACFSDAGQVLLTFTTPQTLKVAGKRCRVRDILFNVDQRDEFLQLVTQDAHTHEDPTPLSR